MTRLHFAFQVRLRFVRAHCRVSCSAPCVPVTAPNAVSEAVRLDQASGGKFYFHVDEWMAMARSTGGVFYVRQVRDGAAVWKGTRSLAYMQRKSHFGALSLC